MSGPVAAHGGLDVRSSESSPAGWTVLIVRGDLDNVSAPRLRERLVDECLAGRTRLILDLRQVQFIDSTGLGVVVGGLRRCLDRGGSLRVVAENLAVLRLLRVTGLARVLPPHPDVDAAAAAPEVAASAYADVPLERPRTAR